MKSKFPRTFATFTCRVRESYMCLYLEVLYLCSCKHFTFLCGSVQALSRSREKRLIDLSRPPVCLSVCPHVISAATIGRIAVKFDIGDVSTFEKDRICLKSRKNIGHVRWNPGYVTLLLAKLICHKSALFQGNGIVYFRRYKRQANVP
jgi:hypothetical protein